MREILFRGKRTDNHQWTEGYYFIDDAANPNPYILSPTYGRVRVAHKSIGQFTGLTDKNGKKIFEGDIIKDDWCKIYKVFYSLKSCSFSVECTEAPNEFETGTYRIGEAWCDTIRVIGNIHDNPELLKGENNG